MRKNAAQRKMDSTRQNLLRANDIISEIKRQVGSITRAAKKAEKYKELKKELDNLQIGLQVKSFSDTFTQIDLMAKEIVPLEDELRGKDSASLSKESELGELRLALIDEEQTLSSHNQLLFEKNSELQRLESEIEMLKNDIETLKERRISKGSEIESISVRIDELTEEINKKELEKQNALSEQESTNSRINDLKEILERHKSDLSEKREGEENIRKKIFESSSMITEKENEILNLEKGIREINARLERLTKEKDDLDQKEQQISFDFENHRLKAQQEREDREKAKRDFEDSDKQFNSLKAEIEELHIEIKSNFSKHEEIKARLNTLTEYEAQMKDYETPMKNLIEESKASSIGKIHQIADVFQPNEGFEVAVQAALGSRLRGVVVEDSSKKEEVVAHIRENNLLRNIVLTRVQGSYLKPKSMKTDTRDAWDV